MERFNQLTITRLALKGDELSTSQFFCHVHQVHFPHQIRLQWYFIQLPEAQKSLVSTAFYDFVMYLNLRIFQEISVFFFLEFPLKNGKSLIFPNCFSPSGENSWVCALLLETFDTRVPTKNAKRRGRRVAGLEMGLVGL
jgi:hypothetical protein